jgi:hypothetical protein
MLGINTYAGHTPIAIFYGPTRVFTAQVVDSILAHDDAQYRSGQWEDHLMELALALAGKPSTSI